jgi:hypothetical protein
MDRKKLLIVSIIAASLIVITAAGVFFYLSSRPKTKKPVTLTEDSWMYETDFEEKIFIPHAKLDQNNGVTDDERLWYAVSGQVMRSSMGDNYVIYMQHFDSGDPKVENDESGLNFYLETAYIQPKMKVKAGVDNQIILYKYDLGPGSDWYVYTKPTGYFMVTEASEDRITMSFFLEFKKRQHVIRSEEQEADLKMRGTIKLKRGKEIKIEPMP